MLTWIEENIIKFVVIGALFSFGGCILLSTIVHKQSVQIETIKQEKDSLIQLANPVRQENLLTDIKVYDGDTITADINVGFGIVLDNQKIRLLDFDAWEISYIRRTVNVTPAEIEKGLKAKADLQTYLADKRVTGVFDYPSSDPYGRLQAILFANNESVSDYMIQKGHQRQ